jgi:hypothetical protein
MVKRSGTLNSDITGYHLCSAYLLCTARHFRSTFSDLGGRREARVHVARSLAKSQSGVECKGTYMFEVRGGGRRSHATVTALYWIAGSSTPQDLSY